MSRVVELLYSRRVPQVAVLALISFGFAGCSADMSVAAVPTNPSPIPLHLSRKRPVRSAGRAVEQPRAAAICAAADTVTGDHRAAAAAGRRAAILSGRAAGVSGGGRGLASYAPPRAAEA